MLTHIAVPPKRTPASTARCAPNTTNDPCTVRRLRRTPTQAVVEVDEEGTVAAAATAVVMLRCAVLTEPPQLVFDRPFLFLIQHLPTGLPAFVGVVNDPTA